MDCALENADIYQTNPKSTQYQSLIDTYVTKGLPGVSLLVKDNSGIYIGSSGMADIANHIPKQACHVSKIASITKMMLGVTIMRMQERGILSIDDPISKYIPDDKLRKISNGNKPVTIKNLLNHTSGFYEVIEDKKFYLQVLNNPQNIGQLMIYWHLSITNLPCFHSAKPILLRIAIPIICF